MNRSWGGGCDEELALETLPDHEPLIRRIWVQRGSSHGAVVPDCGCRLVAQQFPLMKERAARSTLGHSMFLLALFFFWAPGTLVDDPGKRGNRLIPAAEPPDTSPKRQATRWPGPGRLPASINTI